MEKVCISPKQSRLAFMAKRLDVYLGTYTWSSRMSNNALLLVWKKVWHQAKIIIITIRVIILKYTSHNFHQQNTHIWFNPFTCSECSEDTVLS